MNSSFDNARTLVSPNPLQSGYRKTYCFASVVFEILQESPVVDFGLQFSDGRENLLLFRLRIEIHPAKIRPVALGKIDQKAVFIHCPTL